MKKFVLLFLSFLFLTLNLISQEIEYIKTINSESDEIAPFFNSKEDMVIFSSNKSRNFEFYMSYYERGNFSSRPILLQESDEFYDTYFNNNDDDASGYLTLNDKAFFIASKNRKGGLGDYDIYSSKNVSFEWKELKNAGKLNSKFVDKDPTLSQDGETLYFSSNRPGGKGGFDIWYSKLDVFSQTWSEAVNLADVNTSGDEMSPFLASDNKTLFFTSDGYEGTLGGKDFYYVVKTNDKWGKANHLAAPFSSSSDDNYISFSRDGNKCLISSNRNGNYDIFQIKLEPLFYSPITLSLSAIDIETNNPVPVTFSVFANGNRMFAAKGDKHEFVIDKNQFGKNSYLDLEIKAVNPIFPENSSKIRVYNNQSQSKVAVTIFMSENPVDLVESKQNAEKKIETKAPKVEIAYVKGDFVVNDESNNEVKLIKAYETSSTSIKPILNYVFFEENSFTIPRRYEQTKYIDGIDFNEQLLTNLSDLDVYYQILNIIGFRLNLDQSSNLTIIGCNSNTGKEKNNLFLSEKRAQSVANYLADVWGISKNRLILEKRNLPEASTSSNSKEGQAENRRVELYSNNPSVLAPIFVNWKSFKSEPINAKIFVSTVFHKTEGDWELNVYSKEELIEQFKGNSSQDKEIYWSVSDALTRLIEKPKIEEEVKEPVVETKLEEPEEEKGGFFSRAVSKIKETAQSFSNFVSKNIKSFNEDRKKIDEDLANQKIEEDDKIRAIKFELIVKDKNTGQTVVKTKEIPFNQMTLSEVSNPTRYDKFAFISFDFAKSDITEEHKFVLDFINSSVIQENSKIKLFGYTDRIGSAEANMRFSEKRANSVAKSINNTNTQVFPLGKSVLKYDNDLPEGRMYSRTVIAEIETPFIK